MMRVKGPKFFIDFEFATDTDQMIPISVGLVSATGQELYLENKDFDINTAPNKEWLSSNVMPHLKGGEYAIPIKDWKHKIIEFCGTSKIQFIGYCSGYDYVMLTNVLGGMKEKPSSWPYYITDIAQSYLEAGFSSTVPDLVVPMEGDNHSALDDARWTRHAYNAIVSNNVLGYFNSIWDGHPNKRDRFFKRWWRSLEPQEQKLRRALSSKTYLPFIPSETMRKYLELTSFSELPDKLIQDSANKIAKALASQKLSKFWTVNDPITTTK